MGKKKNTEVAPRLIDGRKLMLQPNIGEVRNPKILMRLIAAKASAVVSMDDWSPSRDAECVRMLKIASDHRDAEAYKLILSIMLERLSVATPEDVFTGTPAPPGRKTKESTKRLLDVWLQEGCPKPPVPPRKLRKMASAAGMLDGINGKDPEAVRSKINAAHLTIKRFLRS